MTLVKRVGIAGAFHKANPVCLLEHLWHPCNQLVMVRLEGQQIAGAADRFCGSSEGTEARASLEKALGARKKGQTD